MSDDAIPQTSTGPKTYEENPLYSNADYKPILGNWFTAKPFGFRFTPKVGDAKVMYLPIGPSNLNITTHFATNITPTIYGTVEEHSPVRYYDISIEGTTGMGPKYTVPVGVEEKPDIKKGTQQTGRSSFRIQQDLEIGGFFAKTLATANNIFKAVVDTTTPAVTGLQLDQTGYIAFHNFYRFLLKYKKNVSGTEEPNVGTQGARTAESKHPLVFFNYKDNNEYNVVIRTFTLQRDKENPMLYNYSILMRGYDLKGIDSDAAKATANPASMLETLGLNGVKGSNFLSTAKNIASQAKSVIGSVANGVNQLGR